MHTHETPSGTRIHYNSDYSGMAIINRDGQELEVPATDVRALIEASALYEVCMALVIDGDITQARGLAAGILRRRRESDPTFLGIVVASPETHEP